MSIGDERSAGVNKSRDFYRESGVDVEKGDALVDWLQADATAETSARGEVVSGIGGFAALYRPRMAGMKDPLLVTSTDGVGTKVLLGLEQNQLEGLGIDLVAMCVNDLYTVGAVPLFFLDYYATGVLDESQFKAVLSGIKRGLKSCGAALLGGETAELPGLYKKGHFDLAGFVVGLVEAERSLGPDRVKVGDVLIALESHGFHSNGYSLLRKWITERPVSEETLGRLLQPTKIYYEIPEILAKLGEKNLHALANITGGGISGNLPRVIPEGLQAEIEAQSIPTPPWMRELFKSHGAGFEDVEGVFNMGAGMIAVVSEEAADAFMRLAAEMRLKSTRVGKIISGSGPASVRYI